MQGHFKGVNVVTFGEMAAWTARFNQILAGASKRKRLKELAAELEQEYASYGLFNDVSAYWLHEAIVEEMEVTK